MIPVTIKKRVRSNSNLVRLACSLAVLAALIPFVDIRSMGKVLSEIPAASLAACFGLLFLSQTLSSARFYYLLRDNGIEVPAFDAVRANVYGLIGGLLFFNVFGQGLTRSVLMEKFGISQSTVFFLTLLERATAMLVLFAGALLSAAYLFHRLPMSIESGGMSLVHYVLVGTCVLVVVLACGITARQRRQLRVFVSALLSRVLGKLVLLTLLIHATTLACYVIIALDLIPTAGLDATGSASIIVMLAAAFPISFAGWGFRELSASLAFSQIGFSAEQGLAIAIAIGVLSIFALIANAAAMAFLPKSSQEPRGEAGVGNGKSKGIERPTYWLIGLGAAVAGFFQVILPTRSGAVNVNLGDPIAIIGGLAFLGLAWKARSLARFWRVPHIATALGLATVVLGVGLLRGYWLYGPIDWAIFNRFLGWFVLLAYFCSGGLLVAVAGRAGLSALCRCMVAGAAAIVIWELIGNTLAGSFGVTFGEQISLRADGMANNPNAFAFQLLMGFVALVATSEFRERKRSTMWALSFAGILFAGLWLAGSRAAVGALLVTVIVISVVFRRTISRRLMLTRITLGIVLAAVLLALPDFAAYLPGARGSNAFREGLAVATSQIQSDRVESLRGGLALWMAHPLFGAGLGAYIHEHFAQTGVLLVIHNSALWIAAELGLVGLLAYGLPVLLMGRTLLANRSWADLEPKIVVVGCLTSFAVMSMAHDMLYQRLLWLMLGAAIAIPRAALIPSPARVARTETRTLSSSQPVVAAVRGRSPA